MKYIGSKAKIAKYIVPILQDYIDSHNIKIYIEPFAGGFNVIDKIICDTKIANEIDPLVCNLVTACREQPGLLGTLTTPSKEEYDAVKRKQKDYPAWYRAAILLFGSYNARVYGGNYGAVANTKNGKQRNYFNEAKENFRKQLPNLKDIKVVCGDYRDLIIPGNEKSLIYCDPPYSVGIKYSRAFDTNGFWEWCRNQVTRGHTVFVSEYSAPADFECVWEQEITTHLNNRKNLKRTEKLFILRSLS